MTKDQIVEYSDLKPEMQRYGIAMCDVHNMFNMTRSAREAGFDPVKLAEYARREDSVKDTIRRLDDKASTIDKTCQKKSRLIERLDREVTEYKNLRHILEKFTTLGIVAEDIEEIYVKIFAIARQYKLDPEKHLENSEKT